MKLRKVQSRKDWRGIKKLYNEAFPANEKKPFWMIWLKHRGGAADVWVAEQEGEFSGMAITMNSADLVYAQPEEAGEAVDPNYQKFITGLGLTGINVCPHYQMVKDFYLDGMRLFEEITYGDSHGHEFVALPDGSYILSENGVETIWGEAYLIKDGYIEQICRNGEVFHVY